MFKEEPFEDCKNTVEREASSRVLLSSSLQGNQNFTIRFHKPGDPEFSAVSGATSHEETNFDPRLFNGDSWLSSECHCLKCEGARLIARTRALPSSVPTPASLFHSHSSLSTCMFRHFPVLVLLDLDNFGFRQFQLMPPRLSPSVSMTSKKSPKVLSLSNDDLFASIFLWGFFGSCFTRYHKVWPTEDVLMNLYSTLEKEKESNCLLTSEAKMNSVTNPPPKQSSIWKQLISQKRLLLTPCSGGRQGADTVLRQVVQGFSSTFQIIVVTGDGPLIKTLQEDQGLYSRKRVREEKEKNSQNEEFSATVQERTLRTPLVDQHIRFVHIPPKEKKLVPVWQAIAREVVSLRGPKVSEPTGKKRN